MSHLIVRPGPHHAKVLAVVTEPATVPVGVTTTCEGCGGSISATNDPDATRCYWCTHPELARALGIARAVQAC